MNPDLRIPFKRPAEAVAVLAVALGLALLAVRLDGTFSLERPMQLMTSGWEQMTLYDVWRAAKGLDLYADPLAPPYYSGFYNWLFYKSYGLWSWAWLGLFDLGDEWLPTVARFMTLAALPAGAFAAFHLFDLFAEGRARVMAAAFSVLIVCGPLVGFWAFTVRPDLWALVFEIVAVAVFWRWRNDRALTGLALAALLCFIAWGFKHINLYAAAAIGLFLLDRRRFRDAFAFALMLGGLLVLNFLLASHWYLPSLLQVVLGPVLETGIRNFVNFSVKATPQWAMLGGTCVAFVLVPGMVREVLKHETARFAAIGAASTLVLSMAAAAKDGASEIYFLVASFFMALLAMTALARVTGDARGTRIILAGALAGWTLHAAAIAGVFAGLWGVTDMRPIDRAIMANKACLDRLPGRVFAEENYLQLPWMNPLRPPAFVSFNYLLLRRADATFAEGGFRAMIERGEFDALLLGPESDTFDGASLAAYAPGPPCETGAKAFLRRPEGATLP